MPKLDLLTIPRFLNRELVKGRAKELALAEGKQRGYEGTVLTRHVNLQWSRHRATAVDEFFKEEFPNAKEPKLEPAVPGNPFEAIAAEASKRKLTPAPTPNGFTKAKMFGTIQEPPKERQIKPELSVRVRVRPSV